MNEGELLAEVTEIFITQESEVFWVLQLRLTALVRLVSCCVTKRVIPFFPPSSEKYQFIFPALKQRERSTKILDWLFFSP